MGKALIFKNADFSANSIGTLDSVTITRLGTQQSLWSQSALYINDGCFGYLNATEGYLTGVKIKTATALTFKVAVIRNGTVVMSEELHTTNTTSYATTDVSCSPIKVQSGDYIGVQFLTPNAGVYKSSGGDIDTYTLNPNSGTAHKESQKRIYCWSFKIVTL